MIEAYFFLCRIDCDFLLILREYVTLSLSHTLYTIPYKIIYFYDALL